MHLSVRTYIILSTIDFVSDNPGRVFSIKSQFGGIFCTIDKKVNPLFIGGSNRTAALYYLYSEHDSIWRNGQRGCSEGIIGTGQLVPFCYFSLGTKVRCVQMALMKRTIYAKGEFVIATALNSDSSYFIYLTL